jgi:hypothetical protein
MHEVLMQVHRMVTELEVEIANKRLPEGTFKIHAVKNTNINNVNNGNNVNEQKPPETPRAGTIGVAYLRFSPAAEVIFGDQYNSYVDISCQESDPQIRSKSDKYRGMLARIAGAVHVLHLALDNCIIVKKNALRNNNVINQPPVPLKQLKDNLEISADIMKNVCPIVRFIYYICLIYFLTS